MYSRVMFLLLVIVVACFVEIYAKDLQNDVTTLATPISTLQRSAANGFNSESESLTKRDLKESDLSPANTIGLAAKSYDPPPEFYRGSGSTGQLTSTPASSSSYYSNFRPSNGFKSSPVAFGDNYSNNNYYNKYNGGAGGGGQHDNSYNSWQHIKEKVGVLLNKKDSLQDRISVGTTQHSSSTNGGYAYEGRPYGSQTHHDDYYGSSVAPSAHTSSYYGSSAAAEGGIPFDVYGSKNHYPGSAGYDYASYSNPDIQEAAIHKSHADISHKALLAKSFLIPLASAAVLGITAALVSNPLLLQLGTVSGVAPGVGIYGKRKRRDLTTSATPSNEKNTNRKKDSKLLPYRGHHQQHKNHRFH